MYGSTTGKYRHFVRPLLCCNIYLSRAPCRCLNCYYYPISCLQFRCFFFTNRIESRCVSLSLSVFDLSSGMTNGVLLLVPRESNDENACGIVRALYCSVLLRFFCFVLFCFIWLVAYVHCSSTSPPFGAHWPPSSFTVRRSLNFHCLITDRWSFPEFIPSFNVHVGRLIFFDSQAINCIATARRRRRRGAECWTDNFHFRIDWFIRISYGRPSSRSADVDNTVEALSLGF